MGLGEAAAVLGLLAALNGERGAMAARALAELCDRRDLLPIARVLLRWAEQQAGGAPGVAR